MSSALGEPPDSGVMTPARAGVGEDQDEEQAGADGRGEAASGAALSRRYGFRAQDAGIISTGRPMFRCPVRGLKRR